MKTFWLVGKVKDVDYFDDIDEIVWLLTIGANQFVCYLRKYVPNVTLRHIMKLTDIKLSSPDSMQLISVFNSSILKA